MMAIASWALGLLTVFSFNVWADDSPFHELLGLSAFRLLELLTHVSCPSAAC